MTQDAGAPGPGTAADGAQPSVTDSLAGLDDLPVGAHVARFTAVHDTLRARLDGRDDQDDLKAEAAT